MTDEDAVLAGVRAMLRLAGEDPEREGLRETPGRVLRAWLEMTSRPGDPEALLARSFADVGDVDEMIVVGPVAFVSVCEHHLLPFVGTAHVGYIPNDSRVVGLSKIPRVVEHYARRPQVQERMTRQITDALDRHAGGQGSACVLRARHSCATMRGVRTEAPMTTSSVTGAFRDPVTRSEFMRLCGGL